MMTTMMMIMTTTITSTNMKISLIRAAMGSLLLGGFLHFSFAQEFVQDLGSSVVQAEKPSQAILEGLREDDDLKDKKLHRAISTTIAETIKNEPDVAIRSMGTAAARPIIKGLSGSHVELTEDGAFCGDMSATSPDHAVASEVLTAHRLRVLRGPHILLHSFSAAGGVVQVERNDIPFGDSLFHGYITDYIESAQPGYATAVGANTSVMGLSLKGELLPTARSKTRILKTEAAPLAHLTPWGVSAWEPLTVGSIATTGFPADSLAGTRMA